MKFHDSVLLIQSLDGLDIREDGIYVDVTFGGGGHSKSILNKLGDKGHLYAFDQDEDAAENAADWEHFTFIKSNFKHLKKYMRYYGVKEIDGLLADLGVSSHQFDDPSRGFSYRYDEELDMRMNQEQEFSAKELVRNYSEEDLKDIFRAYGDVPNARRLAHEIVSVRSQQRIETTQQLIDAIEPRIIGNRMKYLSQVFQSIRIAVNDEVGALKELLRQGFEMLAPGGRMVVLSYHSLEDRLVKNFFKTGNFEGIQVKDDFGNIDRPFKIITKKPIIPEREEIKGNVRARSAKLRVAEKK